MVTYNDTSPNSPFAAVEFAEAPQGNRAFVRLKKSADVDAAKRLITEGTGQTVETQAQMDNHVMLVTSGDKSKEELLRALNSQGGKLETEDTKKKVNLWKLRGMGSIIGQPMQFISSYLQPKGLDAATMGFAVSNMAANLINVIFGAQKEEDKHQLRHIKTEVNARLAPFLPPGTEPLDVDDKRSERYASKKTFGQKAYDFGKRYSVTGGDIGLRYIGAISLVLPATKEVKIGEKSVYNTDHWKEGWSKLREAKFDEAWKKLRNNDRATLIAGLLYVGGKALSLTSKVPDPYNTEKKHTALDTVREKIVFPAASVIETSAAALIAMDRLNLFKTPPKDAGKLHPYNLLKHVYNLDKHGVPTHREISLDKLHLEKLAEKLGNPKWMEKIPRKLERDWIGGVGGILFTGALALRIFAPFGVREVNMKEVNAHVADSLAMVPPEKLQQATAETAAFLADHFRDKKDKKMGFGQIYGQLVADLQEYHNITLPGAKGEPAVNAQAAPGEPAQEEARTFAKPELKKPARGAVPPSAAFQDRVTPVSEGMALGG